METAAYKHCSLGKRPITSALEASGFFSGSPDGPILANILALSDIEMIVMLEGGSAEECYSLCQETEDCHSWAFYNKTKVAEQHGRDIQQDMCYLDSRTDLRGQAVMAVLEGGDRDTPPAGMETKGAEVKKTQKQRPTKKSKPSHQATKRPTKKPKLSIRTTTTAPTTTASGDASTTLKIRDSTNPVRENEPEKKNSNKRRKTAPKRKKPLLESDGEDAVVVINADPEFRTEAEIEEDTE